ncbi:MAG: hypothetical protein AAF995_01465 [Planctomycetota bacterium]
MGVLAGLGRVFSKKQHTGGRGVAPSGPGSGPGAGAAVATPAEAGGATGVPRVSDARPGEPVAIDLHEPDIAREGGARRPGEREGDAERDKQLSRKEVVAELQKNYTEVLEIVRKVDQHLDRQEERARELMTLAERTAKAVESLPAMREQGEQLNRAVTDLTKAAAEQHAGVCDGQERIAQSVIEQTGTLRGQTEAIGSLHESVRETVGGMTQATGRLGDAIATIRDAEREREAQLSGLVHKAQKSMLAIVIACGVVSVGTLALVIVVLTRG